MSSPPPVEFQPGMEIVPGYTLITPLGSGMAGDVWQAQAAGGIKVALKVVRNLQDLGGRKELKALKTIRDVHHPNLCPLFGFWTKDADGRVLADGETEELTLDSSSVLGWHPPPNSPAPDGAISPDSGNVSPGMDGTMAIGAGSPVPPPGPAPVDPPKKTKSKVKAEQLIVVMGLGDCTLYDRLKFVRQEAGLDPSDHDTPYGLDATETIRYLRASASAIDLLNQEHQIYHCDIKPQNILLVGGEAQVCDFGLAKQMEGDMRQTQQAFATPAYAPPEVLHGEGYSRQVDQYSLAVTYYELRTGLLPFDITTHASMLVAKSTGKLNLDALSPAERKVLQKALRRVPNERYKSCAEFINALAVAAGVDKSGGITIGRIIAAVAVLILITGAALGGWWYLDNPSFNRYVLRIGADAENNIKEASDQIVKANDEDFGRAVVRLENAMKLSSKAAVESGGDVKTDAESVFADASMNLLTRIHRVLWDAEQGSSSELGGDSKEISDALALLGSTVKSEQSDGDGSYVALGLQNWSEIDSADGDDARNSYGKFHTLYHAAVVRFALLQKSGIAPDSESVVALRESLDSRAEDFGETSFIPLSLASLLPVFTSTQGAATDQWPANRWLLVPLLDDVIRAENAAGSGIGPDYSQRWSELRVEFTRMVAPALKETGATDPAVAAKVYEAFPDIEIAKKVADLRTSLEQSDWTQTQDLIVQLSQENDGGSLDATQSMQLQVAQAIYRYRDDVLGVQRSLQSLFGEQPDFDRLRETRWQSLFANLMQRIASSVFQDLKEGEAFEPEMFRQIPLAIRLRDELQVEIPSDLFAAACVTLLRERPDLISDDAARAELQVDQWLKALESMEASPKSDAYASLAGVVRLEAQIASDTPDSTVVRAALEKLSASDGSLIALVSPSYRDLLMVCAKGMQGDEIAAERKSLSGRSRQSIVDLGNTRLLLATDLFVQQAIKLSGVPQGSDEFVVLRYSNHPTNQSQVERARSYLALADFLIEHTDQETTTALSNERFLESVATGSFQPSSTPIPAIIVEKLRQRETVDQLSTQLLRAIHKVGMEKFRASKDAAPNDNLIQFFVIRPTIALIDRYGVEKFGPNTGKPDSKQSLISEVVFPAMKEIVFPAMSFDEGQLVPRMSGQETNAAGADLVTLCKLASAVYTDPTTDEITDFQDRDYFRRQAIAFARYAIEHPGITEEQKTSLLWRIGELTINYKDDGPECMLDVADSIEKIESDLPVIGDLRSEAHHRLAKQPGTDRAERKRHLQLAYDESREALDQFTRYPLRTDEDHRRHYEVLAKNADVGVQLAFLWKDVAKKVALLEPSLIEIDSAIDKYRSEWIDVVRCSKAAAHITQGNVREDLAFYCSTGPDAQRKEPREVYFRDAAEAFRKAFELNKTDLKTRYSLGRCLFRWGMSLQDAMRKGKLEEASRVLGEAPKNFSPALTDAETLDQISEWFLWKIQVEKWLDNQASAVELADSASIIIPAEQVSVDQRISLSKICAQVFGKNKRMEKAADCITTLEDVKDAESIFELMGVLADIGYGSSSPDPELFSTVLSRIDNAGETGNLTEEDQATYELAKIATYCIRDRVLLFTGMGSRSTTCSEAELKKGPEVFLRLVDASVSENYSALARAYVQAEQLFDAPEDEHDEAIRFATELARLAGRIPEPPSLIDDRSYIADTCNLMVLYLYGYWRSKVDRLRSNPEAYQAALADAKQYIDEDSKKALQNSIGALKKRATGNQNMLRVINGLIDDVDKRFE